MLSDFYAQAFCRGGVKEYFVILTPSKVGEVLIDVLRSVLKCSITSQLLLRTTGVDEATSDCNKLVCVGVCGSPRMCWRRLAHLRDHPCKMEKFSSVKQYSRIPENSLNTFDYINTYLDKQNWSELRKTSKLIKITYFYITHKLMVHLPKEKYLIGSMHKWIW